MAQIITYITYTLSMAAQGKYLRQPISVTDLIPDYLEEKPTDRPMPSIEEQQQQMAQFVAKLNVMNKQIKGQIS